MQNTNFSNKFAKAAKLAVPTLATAAFLAACSSEDSTTGPGTTAESSGSGGAIAVAVIGLLIVAVVVFAVIKKKRGDSGGSSMPKGGIVSSQQVVGRVATEQKSQVKKQAPTETAQPQSNGNESGYGKPLYESDGELPPKLFPTEPSSPYFKPGSEDR